MREGMRGRRTATLDLPAVLAQVLPRPGDGVRGGSRGPGPDHPSADSLLDAAMALLISYGTRRWSMEDVAVRAGVGRATVYRRFDSREQLVRAALAREARRFFSAVSSAVAGVQAVDDKVVAGFLIGIEMAGRTPLASLLDSDPAAAWSLVRSEVLLRTARTALVELYEAHSGRELRSSERSAADAAADALVRLGLSHLLCPATIDRPGLEATVRAIVAPATTAGELRGSPPPGPARRRRAPR